MNHRDSPFPSLPVLICGLLAVGGLTATAAHRPAVPVAQACGVHCGTERWTVKTLTDPDTAQIDPRLRHSTVAGLRLIPRPPRDSLPAMGRVRDHGDGRSRLWASVERSVLQVDIVVVGWKLEVGDSDLHLVIADSGRPRATMIAEVPNPHCAAACSSPHAGEFAAARAAIIAALGKPSRTYRRLIPPRRLTLVGVGFFDFIHGQTGVAPNGVELHPIIGAQVP